MYRFFVRFVSCFAVAALLLLAGCDSGGPATDAASSASDDATAPRGEVIPGQYVVLLDADAQAKSAKAVRAVAQDVTGGDAPIRHVYSAALSGFSVRGLSHAQRDALRADDRVASVVPDRRIQLNLPTPAPAAAEAKATIASQSTPWGVQTVGGPMDGSGTTVWILDTGVDLTHPDLNVDVSRSVDFAGTGTPDDRNGHGTHMAGIAAAIDNATGVVGVAAGAEVVSVKVLNQYGTGSYSNILNGIDYVAANGQPGDAVNMSLGGGYSQTVNNAVANAASQGLYFALVGCGTLSSCSPGSTNGQNVWTITGHDRGDKVSSGVSVPPVDFAAPGVEILSTWIGGGYQKLTGDSTAPPHAAGILTVTNGSPSTRGVSVNPPYVPLISY